MTLDVLVTLPVGVLFVTQCACAAAGAGSSAAQFGGSAPPATSSPSAGGGLTFGASVGSFGGAFGSTSMLSCPSLCPAWVSANISLIACPFLLALLESDAENCCSSVAGGSSLDLEYQCKLQVYARGGSETPYMVARVLRFRSAGRGD